MDRVAFAVAAHPDDVEFMMAGTLLLLGQAGYEPHYMTVANGSCGSASMDAEEIAAARAAEARSAAGVLGATYHGPLVNDFQIHYAPALVAKLCAVVREVNPEIMLIPSPADYMEDHVNVSRLMVTAAFCRNMRNFPTDPPTGPVDSHVALYHAMPAGLRDQLRKAVQPDLCVDISAVLDRKRAALACHVSQSQWLDRTQGMDSYLTAMEQMAAEVGRLSGRFSHAEGWQRHLHLGFGPEDFDPLCDALGAAIVHTRT